ncbi:MAG: ribonuclease P protein component [Bacteroidales bacterium]
MKPQSFPKRERLSSKKIIDKLFATGNTVFCYPVMSKFILENTDGEKPSLKVLTVVPKKRIKKAADRNKVRRRIREAYRVNKLPLYALKEQENKHIYIALVYVSSDEHSYTDLESAINSIIQNILTQKGPAANENF